MTEEYKYIIVGGGIAGGRACEGIRQLDKKGDVVLITREPHRPYEKPPLSKSYLRDEAGLDRVYLKEAGYYAENNIEIIREEEVIKVDPGKRRIGLADGRTLGYQKLLLATGGSALTLPLPGSELGNVFTLRTIGDAQAIREAGGQGKKALVMGGSFIGAEVAASLNQFGSEVTMVFPESRLLEMIVPEEMSEYLHSIYRDRGVRILSETVAEKLVGNGQVSKAILDNGEEIDIDLVVMGVGIELNTELAQDAGLDIREKDQAIIVNEYLQTSDPDIYAAGDIAAWPDATFDKRLQVEHWDVARRQGMLAGRNMAGEKSLYSVLPYFFSDIFDLSFEAWGNLSNWEKTIKRGSIGSGSFAHFYFDDDDRMVGVIAVGRPDDERIPMQSLVEERASFQKFADKLRNEDIKLSQFTAEDSESEDRETEVTISFEEDIRPLFRETDIQEMIEISGFDLSDYDDVRERASGIYARLADGSMPCDQPWPDEQVEKFKRWMESGYEV